VSTPKGKQIPGFIEPDQWQNFLDGFSKRNQGRATRLEVVDHVIVLSAARIGDTLAEIVASAKRDPKAWSFATAQLGAPGHLAAVAFNQYNGLNLPIIVYRGTAPAASAPPHRSHNGPGKSAVTRCAWHPGPGPP